MTGPLTLQPLEIDEGRTAARRMATVRRDTETAYEEALKSAAERERDYRLRLSRAFAELADFQGTAAAREAKADELSAEARYDRDLAQAIVKAHKERLDGLEGERSLLKSLLEFSMRIYERESAPGKAPEFSPEFGGPR